MEAVPERNETPAEAGGWVDAGRRILARLLASDRFRDDLRLILGQIDPDEVPGLVQTALWTDAALAMDLLGALPRAANVAIEFAQAMAEQLDRFPPALLGAVVTDNLARIRFHTLGRAAGMLTRLAVRIGGQASAEPRPGQTFVAGFASEIDAASLRRGVEHALKNNPELIAQVLTPLLGPLLETLADADAQRS
jgi:hypothetical protein